MTPIPEVQPLPRAHRRIVFLLSLLVFALAVPLFVFYAIGYRFDFSGEVSNIKSVGGIYVTASVRDVEMFVDEKPVRDMRMFQNAAYIQNLEAGIHRVHTQAPGVQTWVKDLPVFPRIVTEVASFNMPVVPQIRLITEYETASGESVLFESASSTPLAFASTTNTFFFASSSATTTFEQNPEWVYVETLFASSTEEKRQLQAWKRQQEASRFRFSTDTAPLLASSTATTTKTRNNLTLFEQDGEVYARWEGKEEDIPYYFCIKYESASSTALWYGQHIYDSFVTSYGSSTNFRNALHLSDRLCRDTIRIDRLWQSVQSFDFVPGTQDLVLMQLQDGVYVVEIDDRSWQNTQLLYPGDYLQVVVDGGQIFIKDGPYYMEVFTTLQQ